MDIIYLKGLRIDTVIGVYEWERRIKQTVIIDLDMATDNRAAALRDNIDGALNYKMVAKRLIEFTQQSQFQLLETLAERLAEIIMHEFGVRWLQLRLNKQGAVRHACDVGVLIERGEKV